MTGPLSIWYRDDDRALLRHLATADLTEESAADGRNGEDVLCSASAHCRQCYIQALQQEHGRGAAEEILAKEMKFHL